MNLAAGHRRAVVRAVAGVVLLIPVAHLFAIAYEWLYFPPDLFEDLLAEGPLAGDYAAAILRGTGVCFAEMLAVAGVAAWLIRNTGASWARAAGDAALSLAPLAAAPLALFRDDLPSRVMLFACVVGLTTGFVVLRILPRSLEDGRRSRWPGRLAPAMCAVAATYFASLALLRHASYWSSIIDLGLFSGSLRSTLHGDGFLYAPELGSTFMAEHFSPILVLLLPFYAVFESPATLLVIQSVVVAAGAYLLYRLADDVLGDGWAALAVCASYLLAPDTFQSQWHDFHMDLLMPPMIFGAVLALRGGRTNWFLLCVGLLWATKEDAFIYTAALGAYAWAAHGRRRLGISLALASLAFGVLLIEAVMPALRTFQHEGRYFSEFTGEGYKFAFRYEHLGKSPGEMLVKLLLDPVYVAGHILGGVRLGSLLTLLAPLGFAALLGGLRPLLLFAPVGVMLLASDDNMAGLRFYYGAIPLALAYAAGVVGIGRLRERLARFERHLGPAAPRRFVVAATAYVAAVALVLAHAHPESHVSPAHERPAYLLTDRTALLDEIVESIPPDVPIAATGYAGIHLMNRPRPRMIPFGIREAEYLIVDLYRPPWPLEMPALAWFVERFAWGDAESGEDTPWGLVRAENGVIVFRRGAPRDRNHEAVDMMYEPVIEPEEWELSDFPNLATRYDSASGGAALVVTPGDRRGPGFLYFGPFLPLPAGSYRVEFRLAAAPEWARPDDAVLATIEAARNDEVVSRRDLCFADFGERYTWRTFSLNLLSDNDAPWTFRVWYHDAGTVALDVIRVMRIGGQ